MFVYYISVGIAVFIFAEKLSLYIITKLKPHWTLIRPIVTYANEKWVIKKNSIQKLLIFERKILRKIFGPTKKLNGLFRDKTNEEFDEPIHRKNIIRFIKSRRLKWISHAERTPKESGGTRIYKWKPLTSRPIGRSKNRWKDDVRKDWQTEKVTNWKKSASNSDSRKTTAERTKLT
jgi:hypothetical protein